MEKSGLYWISEVWLLNVRVLVQAISQAPFKIYHCYYKVSLLIRKYWISTISYIWLLKYLVQYINDSPSSYNIILYVEKTKVSNFLVGKNIFRKITHFLWNLFIVIYKSVYKLNTLWSNLIVYLTSWYSWNITKVDVKHQSINHDIVL